MTNRTLHRLVPIAACLALAAGCTAEHEPEIDPDSPAYDDPNDPASEERVDLAGFLPLEVGNIWIYEWESRASSYSKYGSSNEVDEGLAVLEITGRRGDAFDATWTRPGMDVVYRTYQVTSDAIFVDGEAAVAVDDPENVFGLLRTARMATIRFDDDALHMSSEEQDGCYGCTIAGVQIWTPEEETTSSETSVRGIGVTRYAYSWKDESYDFKFSGGGSADLVAHRLYEGSTVVGEAGDVDALLAEAGAQAGGEG